jgi:putative phage-type endonuclease
MPFTDEQLAERRKFIGASEASAALGLNPFFSQVDLYLDKIGEGIPFETTIPMMVGTALEPVTLELFERQSGLRVEARQKVYRDPKCAWRRCTVDGMTDDGAIVEAKTSGDFRGWGDGGDEVPQHYLLNAMHSLSCVPEALGVHFPVLVGGRTYRCYYVPRDEELIGMVADGEAQFMEHVRQRIAPAPKSLDDMKALYPKSSGTPITATEEVEKAAQRIAFGKRGIKKLQEMIDEDMLIITSFMKEHSELRRLSLTGAQGAVLATWNSQERRTIDADALRANYPDIAKAVTRVSTNRIYLNKIKE